MQDKIEIEFFAALNEDGEYDVSTDKDSVCDNLSSGATRIVKFTLLMAPPEIKETKIELPGQSTADAEVTINA
jgi:hypothetical protein